MQRTWPWPLLKLVAAALAMAFATSNHLVIAVEPQQPNRFEAEIAAMEQADRQAPPPKGGVVFVGSSSIRLWDLKQSFPDFAAVNRGFGGSQVSDSVYFVERIVLPLAPRVVVVYAGDNDIAAGKSPEQVADDYRALVAKLHAALPETNIIYIAIKPSIQRWKLIDKVRAANKLIRAIAGEDQRLSFVDVEPAMLGDDGQPKPELFQKDGLHLNAAGYAVWAEMLGPHLAKNDEFRSSNDEERKRAGPH